MSVKIRVRPLAALLLLALLHNGVAAPSMAAPASVPPADAGMAHHGHDGMMDPDSGGIPMGATGSDCCDHAFCDCSCTATPVFLPAPATAARDWARSAAVRTPDTLGFRPAITGAPFRPPA